MRFSFLAVCTVCCQGVSRGHAGSTSAGKIDPLIRYIRCPTNRWIESHLENNGQFHTSGPVSTLFMLDAGQPQRASLLQLVFTNLFFRLPTQLAIQYMRPVFFTCGASQQGSRSLNLAIPISPVSGDFSLFPSYPRPNASTTLRP